MFASYNECKKFTPQLLSVELHCREIKAHFPRLKPIELLAELLCHCGWYLYETVSESEALGVLQTARSICKELFASTPNKLFALILSNIGVIYSSQNQGAKALEVGLLAHEYRRKCLGEEDPQIGESCNNCVGGYHDRGKLDEAQKLFEESVTLQETNPNRNVDLLEGAYSNLGRNLMALRRFEDAQSAY